MLELLQIKSGTTLWSWKVRTFLSSIMKFQGFHIQRISIHMNYNSPSMNVFPLVSWYHQFQKWGHMGKWRKEGFAMSKEWGRKQRRKREEDMWNIFYTNQLHYIFTQIIHRLEPPFHRSRPSLWRKGFDSWFLSFLAALLRQELCPLKSCVKATSKEVGNFLFYIYHQDNLKEKL